MITEAEIGVVCLEVQNHQKLRERHGPDCALELSERAWTLPNN